MVAVSVLWADRFYFVKNEKTHILSNRFIWRSHIFETMTDDATRVFHYDTEQNAKISSQEVQSLRDWKQL
jgi:hypothetical protein